MNTQAIESSEAPNDCTPFLASVMLRNEITPNPALGGEVQLLGSRTFRATIEREMSRSDRTSMPLTLLIFKVASEIAPERQPKILFRLSRAVLACSRKSDVPGFYRDSSGTLHVGLLLDATDATRASAVIEKIRNWVASLEPKLPNVIPVVPESIICEIYGYAGEAESEETGGPQQLWLFEENSIAEVRALSHEGASARLEAREADFHEDFVHAELQRHLALTHLTAMSLLHSFLTRVAAGARRIRRHWPGRDALGP